MNPVLKITHLLSSKVVLVAVIILLAIFSFQTCNENKHLQSNFEVATKTIDDLSFKNKILKTSDSTHAIEVKAVTFKSSKDIHRLRDSLSIAMGSVSKLQKELGIIKFKSTFQPNKLPVLNIDSMAQAIRDSLKNLPCDSLKQLADSNLLFVPSRLKDVENKNYAFKGRITRDGVDFDSTYPRFYSRPTIIYGQKRSWLLGKWHMTAQIGDENPYALISDGKFIAIDTKERKFGVTVGYGLMYDIQKKNFTHGPSVVFGFRF